MKGIIYYDKRINSLKPLLKDNEKAMLDRQREWLCSEDHMGENFKFLYITKKDLDPVYPFIDTVIHELNEIIKTSSNS